MKLCAVTLADIILCPGDNIDGLGEMVLNRELLQLEQVHLAPSLLYLAKYILKMYDELDKG